MLDQSKILTWVDEQHETCRKARLQFEVGWYTYLAFYFGKQYVQWSPQLQTAGGVYQRLYEPKAPPWRVRMVVNKVRSTIRREHSKICKENPQPYVMPASSDDTDIAAARSAETIFEYLWRDLKMKRVMRRMAWWLCLTGCGVIKDWYDPSSPDSSGIPGRLRGEVVTPFHLFAPEMEEEDIEAQPFIIHEVAKTPDFVYGAYGIDLAADSTGGGGTFEQKFLQALGLQQQGGYDRVRIREAWVKPGARFPQGAVITWATDRLLSVTPMWPFAHDEYPFTKFDHIPTGRFYSESVIADLIPIQKEYNRTRSQIIEAKNKMAKPQLLAMEGSINPNKLTTEPGLVIFYKPGFHPPEQIDLKPLPNYVPQELDRCDADFNDMSAQHEVSHGQAPPGVTAATAISYLQEEDDSMLSNTISSIEEGVEKLGKHFLVIVNQFWELPRTIRVTGSDGMYESYVLKGADISGNTDLNIQSGSAMPRSRAAKQAFIMELGKLGWITPDKALRYLDLAETGKMYEELQRDTRQAQRENLKMMSGQQVMVNTWDEHMIHVQEHNNQRKGQDFENAPDQVKQLFEEHVQTHQMAMMQLQQQALQTQMGGGQPQLGPGGPAQPGGPPAPGGPRPLHQPVSLPPDVLNQDSMA